MKMKKLYMIFALALSAIVALQPQIQADGRDVIGGSLLGATVGGIAAGGTGAAVGAGVGALSGAAVGSARAQDRYYYDAPYYDDYDDSGYDYDYYPRERYYRGGYYRGGGYYGPGVGIGVGLPFFMDINNEIYSRDTMEDFPQGYYPRNRNYMPGLNAPDYKEYWQKEGFFPPQEYEVELGAPRDGYSSSCDITTNVETVSDVALITPEDEGMYFDSGSERPLRLRTASESVVTPSVVTPVAEATADVVESVSNTAADLVRPVARATGSTVRSIGEAIEDAATPNPIIEEEDIVIIEPVEATTYTAPAITNRRPVSYNRGSVVRPVEEVTEDVVVPVAETTARTAERVGEATADVVAPVAEAAEEVVTAPLRIF